MGERKKAADMVDVLDRVARGVIVDSALPVSATVEGLRRVDGQQPSEEAPLVEPPSGREDEGAA